jgi:putative component of membrane protein insertase Oxa1/YidC/SpoIIIJ protein YidD
MGNGATSMIKAILRFLILGLRPLLGPARCKYRVGCTQYTLNQLKKKPLIPALIASTKRILSCW